MKKNRKPQRCRLCGQIVGPGKGDMSRREDPRSGKHKWLVVHADGCPVGGDEPTWSVPVAGENRTAIVHSRAMPAGGIPLDAAARAVAEPMPRPAPRTADEHRAEILARMGVTA